MIGVKIMPHQTFGEIKAHARGSLNGSYGIAILSFIDTMLLSFLPAYIVDYLFPNRSVFEMIGSEIVSFILTCFVGILEVGLSLIYLKICSRQKATIADLFYGYRVNRNHSLMVCFVYTVIAEICSLPYVILSSHNAANAIYAPQAEYLTLICGMLLTLILRLPISQSFFILVDFPEYSGVEALKLSMKLMKGNYVRYILFLLSFVPFILLSILSFFIGLLWTIPYVYASTASFYLELAKSSK